MSQAGKVIVADNEYEVSSGSTLRVKEGDIIEEGTVLVTFDPYHIPLIAAQDGKVEYRELTPKKTYDENMMFGNPWWLKPWTVEMLTLEFIF